MTEPTEVIIFFMVFAAVVAAIIFQIVRFGFRGALFGGKIIETISETKLDVSAPMSGKVRTHIFQSKDGMKIGLEISHASPMSWSSTPVVLTAAQANEIAQALTIAAKKAL